MGINFSLIVSFEELNIFISWIVIFHICFCGFAFCILEKTLLTQIFKDFSCYELYILPLRICCELIFAYFACQSLMFIFSKWIFNFSNTIKDFLSLIELLWDSWQISIGHVCMLFFSGFSILFY